MGQMLLLIRKGTTVWVGKDLSSTNLTLFRHTMKHDLAIPYPTADDGDGPKVISLARDVESIREPKRMMLKLCVLTHTPGPANSASLLDLLEAGFDVFVTDHETYPMLIVHSNNVDEVDEIVDSEWVIEDKGGGLQVHTRRVQNAYPYWKAWEEQHR